MTLRSPRLFCAEITACAGRVIFIDLFGQLHPELLPELRTALEAATSVKPRQLVVDLTNVEFICPEGYDAIGACRAGVERLTVCSKNDLAKRMLAILGHEGIEFTVGEVPDRDIA